MATVDISETQLRALKNARSILTFLQKGAKMYGDDITAIQSLIDEVEGTITPPEGLEERLAQERDGQPDEAQEWEAIEQPELPAEEDSIDA